MGRPHRGFRMISSQNEQLYVQHRDTRALHSSRIGTSAKTCFFLHFYGFSNKFRIVRCVFLSKKKLITSLDILNITSMTSGVDSAGFHAERHVMRIANWVY
jgi:hypothetical protein